MEDLKQETPTNIDNHSECKAKNISKKTIIILAGVIAIIIAVCIIIVSTGLNEYDTLIYENCKTLQREMKNPDSLKIYDEVFILKPKDDDILISFIKAGGSNSYGGMESDVIVFIDSYYMGTYDSMINLAEKTSRQKQICAGYFEYQMHMMGADFAAYEYIEIDVDAVRNKLGLK